MPSLITNYKRQEASARLKKFNSMMGQALILSVNENGDVNEWDTSLPPDTYFPDGTSMSMTKGRCMDCKFDINGTKNPNIEGRDQFVFLACDKTITEWCPNKGWCTYRTNNNLSREKAMENCKSIPTYCSYLLELDNWEFKSDYPYRL